MPKPWPFLVSIVLAVGACASETLPTSTPSQASAPSPTVTVPDPDTATIPPSFSPALVAAVCGQVDDAADVAARLLDPVHDAATPAEIVDLRIASLAAAIAAEPNAAAVAILQILLDDWRAISTDLGAVESPEPGDTGSSLAAALDKLNDDLAGPVVVAITGYCGAGI